MVINNFIFQIFTEKYRNVINDIIWVLIRYKSAVLCVISNIVLSQIIRGVFDKKLMQSNDFVFPVKIFYPCSRIRTTQAESTQVIFLVCAISMM